MAGSFLHPASGSSSRALAIAAEMRSDACSFVMSSENLTPYPRRIAFCFSVAGSPRHSASLAAKPSSRSLRT